VLGVQIVIEAVFQRRTVRELRIGKEGADRLGHHVRGAVPQQVQAVRVLVIGGEQFDLAVTGQGGTDIGQRPRAVHRDRAADRGAGQPRADLSGDIVHRRALSQGQRLSIR
jgi:hypothetical protein